ncbi:MAG: toxin-antitoxin system YwqK family antitoxin [Reichenbachiella sp.]|uniref:toxin-antitoxin system YwqK family antitoxin n=1 Tax=Reichenbachiella sp. TaxID=2184521 RepID=UPI003266AB97
MQSTRILSGLLVALVTAVLCSWVFLPDQRIESLIENKTSIKVEKKELSLHANEGRVYFNNLPFDGWSVQYHLNGQLAEQIQFIEGKKMGMTNRWYQDGTLSYTAQHKANRLDGEVKSWWPNGVLRSQSNFVNGRADGTQYQWYKSGKPFKEINLKMGLEEGLQRAWRENGKLYTNYEAKNGRIFGLKRASLCYELGDETIL